MNTRDTELLSCRPTIPGALITKGISDQEHFQNSTLRPIAKLQNDLFVLVFKNYITKHKNVFYNLTIEKRLSYIDNAIQKHKVQKRVKRYVYWPIYHRRVPYLRRQLFCP